YGRLRGAGLACYDPAMLTISDLTYRIAGRTLLESTSAQINAGWKVGLVGRNGTGKSTLLTLIRGELQPDGGDIRLQKDVRVGFVAQEVPGGVETPAEVVLAADAERLALLAAAEEEHHAAAEHHERLLAIDAHRAPARAAAILAGLGFDHEAQQQPLSSFSGGWRMRVALAAALFAEPDLLLLDEPTNHLDLEAALWLGEFLRRYRGTVILVSHDRQFVDDIADHILHLGERRLTLYSGGYETFLRTRREALAHQQALAAKQASARKHLQAFVDRFRAKASKASQAQSRIKMLARLEPVALAETEAPVRFEFPDPAELAPPLLTLDHVAVGYAPGRPVLRRLDLRLDPDDRIALLGANGNGKTTLARLMAGRLPAMEGEVRRAPRLTSGYFAQHQIEELDAGASAFDHLARLMPKATPEAVRARLARFGFGADKVFVAAGDLSGGEKARLNFALMSHAAPALLILDEPTNHLDIEAREALVTALGDFAGAVVIVSHDWHLLSLTADRLWLVADGTVRPWEGDLDDYRRYLLETRPAEPDEPEPREKRLGRRAAANRRGSLAPLKRALRAAEERLAALTQRKAELDRQLADPATYAGAAPLQALLREQADASEALAEAEAQWLAAAEAVERAGV
ncbi:MAG TPA: ABC-F family ATP-binding cassette domain-containing protein, partial [Stellaceae bacterium]|nr:ABC-F family ATP-binding cassette domain-containing protein [Stellaceae bacterium]